MDIPTGDNKQPNMTDKRRIERSIVWQHFNKEIAEDGCIRAYCKQCGQSFSCVTGKKQQGTSHLKRHIAKGNCAVSPLISDSRQTDCDVATSNVPRKRCRANPPKKNMPFSKGRTDYELAKMVILQNLPLNFAEKPGFINFIKTVQPHFGMVKFSTVEADCFSIFLREKENLLHLLDEIPGRVSLTVDLWSSNQTVGYAIITGHFLDSKWKLNRRILSVVMFPNSQTSCELAIKTCLKDWKLKGKLFTITFEKSLADDIVKECFRGILSFKNPSILNGQLLIGNCYSRVLGRLAQEALGSMDNTIIRIRETFKYIESSKTVEQKFMNFRRQLQVPSMKSLAIDNVTKWDSTYNMLVTASEFQNVFSCLKSCDTDYKETPSVDEWKQIETLCSCLKLLFDAANVLKATPYPTTNIFFHEVLKIQGEFAHASMSEDTFIYNLIKPLKEIFDKYWNDTWLVLAMAVVMDPRFKMKFVEFSFRKIYGENADPWIQTVLKSVNKLFLEYQKQSPCGPTCFYEGSNILTETEILYGESFLLNCVDLLDINFDFDVPPNPDFDAFIASNQQVKIELDKYLEESLLLWDHSDFDVLGWWNKNSVNYPILSRIAADVLMIPVSTFGPDSVFNKMSNKMDSYRTSLRPTTLQALICAKDWLQ